jgi:hypothetical protein
MAIVNVMFVSVMLLLLLCLKEERESGRKPPLPWNEPVAFDGRVQKQQAMALLSRCGEFLETAPFFTK